MAQPLTKSAGRQEYGRSVERRPCDGRLVLTASENHTARLWDAATGQPLARMVLGSNVPHATFSPDGRRIVSVSVDRTARIWDTATGKPLAPPMRHRDTTPDPGTATGAVNYGWFSPDGKRVMTVTSDGRVRLWDAQTSEPLTPPLRHWGTVRYAVFSPDGRSSQLRLRSCSVRC